MADDRQHDLGALRVDYRKAALDESAVHPDPIEQFARWFADARAAGVTEPNAMTLATADPEGRPSARIVLLKDFDARGFTFYTNYGSRKATDLESNPRAALVFFWAVLERQVRIDGDVTRVSRGESRAYFDTRPIGSRIGAWASKQSEVVLSRDQLESQFRDAERKIAADGGDPPMPGFWGGYRVTPRVIEFWQGRSSRLHDRLRYRRDEGGAWVIERLSP
ncbi:MAG TPA: pyridoxamine 5'-phosphate oxidase [Tepidisphaeraceae bacterium]|jgi:pyridoxamine 5'-phosphate oxidase